jgi:uncharacterized protein (TIGR03437 family)
MVPSANPAAPGETILMYLAGLGIVTPPPVTSALATGLTTTDQKVAVAVAGQAPTVSYHGLAPT